MVRGALAVSDGGAPHELLARARALCVPVLQLAQHTLPARGGCAVETIYVQL